LSKLNSDFNFRNKMFYNGKREGNFIIYEKYPLQCVGPATFFWKQKVEQDEVSELMIWVHPLMKDAVLKLLDAKDVSVTVRNNLSKFELRGPNSLLALRSVLRIAKENDEKTKKYWNILTECIKRPDGLSKKMIFALTIDHPLTGKNEDEEMKESFKISRNERVLLNLPDDIAVSNIWGGDDSEILLIHHDSPMKTGFGSGVDLICSKSYGVHLLSQLSKLSNQITY
jgi:hypothetical protein